MKKIFSLKVRPQAKKTEIIEIMADDSVKIAVKATPEKGRANKEIEDFFQKTFGGQWKIIRGFTASRKWIEYE